MQLIALGATIVGVLILNMSLGQIYYKITQDLSTLDLSSISPLQNAHKTKIYRTLRAQIQVYYSVLQGKMLISLKIRSKANAFDFNFSEMGISGANKANPVSRQITRHFIIPRYFYNLKQGKQNIWWVPTHLNILVALFDVIKIATRQKGMSNLPAKSLKAKHT